MIGKEVVEQVQVGVLKVVHLQVVVEVVNEVVVVSARPNMRLNKLQRLNGFSNVRLTDSQHSFLNATAVSC